MGNIAQEIRIYLQSFIFVHDRPGFAKDVVAHQWFSIQIEFSQEDHP
jgi:hypothetical protein